MTDSESSDVDTSSGSDTEEEEEEERDREERNRETALGLKPAPKVTFEESKKQIDKLPRHFVMLLIGSRGSGKTFCLIHMLINHFRNRFSMIVIFSNTWNLQDQTKLVDGEGVFICENVEHSERVLGDLRDFQRTKKPEEREDVLVIFDDNGSRLKDGKAQVLTDVLTAGRHTNESVIILSQRSGLTTTTARCQADAVLLWRETTPHELSQLFRSIGSDPEEKTHLPRDLQRDRFRHRFDQYTRKPRSIAMMRKDNLTWKLSGFEPLTEKQKKKARKRDKKTLEDNQRAVKRRKKAPETSVKTKGWQSQWVAERPRVLE